MRRVSAVVALVALFSAACTAGGDTTTTGADPGSSTTGLTVPEDTEYGVVSGIINGDTVQVMINEEPTAVRLLGIRAPQGDECYAEEAGLALAGVAAGRSVAVVGDLTEEDGTPLRYLIIDDDVPLLVNVELVAIGAAAALHGHELAGDFLRVNDRAYASGRGMWGTFVCGHPEQGAADRPQLRIDGVRLPGSGDDAAVDVINASYTEIAVGSWTLRDAAASSIFTFPTGQRIAAGDVLTIPMGCDDTGGQTWCTDPEMFSGGGSTLLIQDERGNVVERYVVEMDVPS